MPRARIEVGHIIVELEANEASISDLSKQAIELARECKDINPNRMSMGFKVDHQPATTST